MRVASHRAPHFVFVEHEFELPLDHENRRGDKLTVFAREVVKAGRENDDLPWLVFFQGGPGQRVAAPAEARLRDLVGPRPEGLPRSCSSTSAGRAAPRRSATCRGWLRRSRPST